MSQTVNADLPSLYLKVIQSDIRYAADSGAVTTGRVYLTPITIPVDVTINKISIDWGSVAAGNARVGIYRDNGGTPAGAALVVETGSVAKSGTYRFQEFTVANTRLTKGLHWLAVISDENTTKLARAGSDIFVAGTYALCGYYDRGGGYGALTDPCPAITASSALVPVMAVIVYSVP